MKIWCEFVLLWYCCEEVEEFEVVVEEEEEVDVKMGCGGEEGDGGVLKFNWFWVGKKI